MEQGREEDRTEAATPQKLRDARARGQVAKSMDANAALVLLGALVSIYFSLSHGATQLLGLSHALLAQAGGVALRPEVTVELFRLSAVSLGAVLLPLFLAAVIAGVAANLLQSGFIWSVTPLKPDLTRINPVTGFKRIFSKRTLYELAKTLVKTLAICGVLYLVIRNRLGELIAFVDLSPTVYVPRIGELVLRVAFAVLAAFGAIAIFDLVYTRWEYATRMRMSRREVKEEIRRREGDPMIRSRMRQLRNEAVKRAAGTRRVKDANVVITNPTHLAVALQYQRDTMVAPKVVAKGAGVMAGAIRRVAARHGVPVVENRPLARELFRMTIDAWVPDKLFPQVAKVLVWAAMVRERAVRK